MNSVTRTFEIERITSDRFHLKIVLARCLVCGEAGAQNWIEDVVVRTALWTFSSFTGRFVLFESLREKSSLDKKKNGLKYQWWNWFIKCVKLWKFWKKYENVLWKVKNEKEKAQLPFRRRCRLNKSKTRSYTVQESRSYRHQGRWKDSSKWSMAQWSPDLSELEVWLILWWEESLTKEA